MTTPHTTMWVATCRSCGTTDPVDLVLPVEVETGLTCPACGSANLALTDTHTGVTFGAALIIAPAVPVPAGGWECCHCCGTQTDFYGEVCPHCEGTGRC